MERPETNEIAAIDSSEEREIAPAKRVPAAVNSVEPRQASPLVVPSFAGAQPAQMGSPLHCPTCGGTGMEGGPMMTSFVYALGHQIEARFPRPSVEKEMAQAPAERRPRGARINKLFIKSFRDARTAMSRGKCAGFW